MDDVLGAPVSRGTADPDFAIFGDDCLLKVGVGVLDDGVYVFFGLVL